MSERDMKINTMNYMQPDNLSKVSKVRLSLTKDQIWFIMRNACQGLVTRPRLTHLTERGEKYAQLKDFGSSIGSPSQLMRWTILDLLPLFICAVNWKGFGG